MTAKPVLSRIINNRLAAFIIMGFSFMHIIFSTADLAFWQCPIKLITGIPCPGCGLSRAIILLFTGNWQEALRVHAFAPIFLIGLIIIGLSCVLSSLSRQRFILLIEKVEIRTGIVTIVLIAVMVYWGFRLLIPGLQIPTGISLLK